MDVYRIIVLLLVRTNWLRCTTILHRRRCLGVVGAVVRCCRTAQEGLHNRDEHKDVLIPLQFTIDVPSGPDEKDTNPEDEHGGVHKFGNHYIGVMRDEDANHGPQKGTEKFDRRIDHKELLNFVLLGHRIELFRGVHAIQGFGGTCQLYEYIMYMKYNVRFELEVYYFRIEC